jgi:hypothetical protein
MVAQVIAHELSNSLVTLRLANVYDLSSVRLTHRILQELR